jgi:hypothetical protein
MGFFRFNDPATVPWYHHGLDLMVFLCFVLATAHAVRQARQGRRDLLVLIATAILYGMTIELSGMIWHRSYVQGDFTVMLGFNSLSLFEGSTDMPLYVPFFYPVFLTFGYELTQAFGFVRPWQRAVAGGFLMGLLDTGYIIEGGLRHVVWWTWGDWWLYELWLGWPLVDLWWEMTWHAVIFWLIYRTTPKVDAWFRERSPRTARVRAYLLLPLAIAVVVNLVCPVLHLPLIVASQMGASQAPWVALLFVAFGAVFLFSEKRPEANLDRSLSWRMAIYLAALSPMVIANAVHEGRFTDYCVVQTLALIALVITWRSPVWLARRTPALSPAARSFASRDAE